MGSRRRRIPHGGHLVRTDGTGKGRIRLSAVLAVVREVLDGIHTGRCFDRTHTVGPNSGFLYACPLQRFAKTSCILTVVTSDFSHVQVRSPPAEGVYIHGLFLDGAAWSKQEGVMVESEPKKLFVSLPVLFVSANTKSDQVLLTVRR